MGLLCHPPCAALGVPVATHDQGDTWCERQGRDTALLWQKGWSVLVLHMFCWQVADKLDGGSSLGLNWFNKVKCLVMSKKGDRLLPGVGLDDLMGYLLSVSQL